MPPRRPPRNLGDLFERAAAAVQGLLEAETVRVSQVDPDLLDVLVSPDGIRPEGGYDGYGRILLRPDIWRDLDSIVHGRAQEVPPRRAAVAAATLHHEHIHGAGESQVEGSGYLYDDVSIPAADRLLAKRLEEAVTEVWNSIAYSNFVDQTGLADLDPRLLVHQRTPRYTDLTPFLEATMSGIAAVTGIRYVSLAKEAARHTMAGRLDAMFNLLLAGRTDRPALDKQEAAFHREVFKREFPRIFMHPFWNPDAPDDRPAREADRIAQTLQAWW